MNTTGKMKRTKIIPISCGICKMDCENCKEEKLIREHNNNIELLIEQDNNCPVT